MTPQQAGPLGEVTEVLLSDKGGWITIDESSLYYSYDNGIFMFKTTNADGLSIDYRVLDSAVLAVAR